MPPDMGDHAVGTVLVAAVRYLQIRAVGHPCLLRTPLKVHISVYTAYMACPDPLSYLVNSVKDAVYGGGPYYHIDLGKLLHDLILISLGKTAADDDALQGAAGFCRPELYDGIYAFFLCVSYKAAGIYYGDISLILILCDLVAVCPEKPYHLRGINEVFVTSEGYKKNPDAVRTFLGSDIVRRISHPDRGFRS